MMRTPETARPERVGGHQASHSPRVSRQKDPEAPRVCAHCGDAFISKNGAKKNRAWYCGYCFAVHFGEPYPNWPPKVTKTELHELQKNRGVIITRLP